ncbi:MAG: glycosyltransferase [Proteobacteria bacterium]|nr:glycosyltransferase [Pseudomonadota bacterium]
MQVTGSIGNFLKTLDIFVLASYVDGLGISLLDAQACGLPVIGCRVDGSNGVLVPSRGLKLLADSILILLDDEKRNRLGGAARISV